MPWLTVIKLVGVGLLVLLVVGGAWMLRDELIAKGENIIKAQDNAALVRDQREQAKRDAVLIASQNSYINDLQSAGSVVKEKIRVVQGPCVKDGTDDPRLGDLSDWMRGRPGYNLPAPGGPPPQGALPAASPPAAKR